MAEENSAQDGEDAPDPRLDSLETRLREVRKAKRIRSEKANYSAKGMRQGNRVLTELIAGPAGGTLIGWVLDRLLGTAPWLLLLCLFLGIAVAFRNIIKISNERPE